MPLVIVRYQPNNDLGERTREALGKGLRWAVSSYLTCDDPDGQLTERDIEVFFEPYKPEDQTDLEVFISIEASSFPSRKKDSDSRVRHIGEFVADWLPHGTSFGLWVKLIDNPGWFTNI